MQDRCLPVLTLFLAICLCSLDPAVTWMPAQRKCTGQVCVLNACDYLQQRFTIFPPRCLLKHSITVQNKTKHLLNSFNLVSHLRSLMAGIRRRKQTPILYVQYHALKSKLRVLINYNALPAILRSALSQDKQNSQLIWVSRGRLEGAGPTASPGRPEDGCTHQPVCPRLTGAVGPLQLPLPQVINSPYPEPQHAGEPPQAQNPAAHGLSAEHRHTPKTCWFKSIYVVSHLNTDSKAYTALKQVVPPSTWDQHCSPRQEGQHSFFSMRRACLLLFNRRHPRTFLQRHALVADTHRFLCLFASPEHPLPFCYFMPAQHFKHFLVSPTVTASL